MRSPIKWAGGKSRLRKYIVPIIENAPHTCYVEVFGGAGWVLFRKEPSNVEIFNDIDGELVNFFRAVRDNPKELIDSFRWDLISEEEFNRLAMLENLSGMSRVERAHRFYYLIMAAWGGELQYPRFQTSISDNGGGNRLIGALKNLENRILPAHERLRRVIIQKLDWRDCISRYDRDGVIMYLDPPYPNNNVNYLHNIDSEEEHIELAKMLKNSRCKWVLSSYDNEFTYSIFPKSEWNIIPIRAKAGMKNSSGKSSDNKEVLVLNFNEQ